jgi:hypothetical protein
MKYCVSPIKYNYSDSYVSVQLEKEDMRWQHLAAQTFTQNKN